MVRTGVRMRILLWDLMALLYPAPSRNVCVTDIRDLLSPCFLSGRLRGIRLIYKSVHSYDLTVWVIICPNRQENFPDFERATIAKIGWDNCQRKDSKNTLRVHNTILG